MASNSCLDKRPIVGGGGTVVFPIRKLTSTSCRVPILSIDAIDELLQPDNSEMKTVLGWIDEQTFSRPKKHLHRDFSDGVMMAELIHHFIPKIVELHNYIPANSVPAKRNNWKTLNRKVFSKLDFSLSDSLIEFLSMSKTGAVEVVLKHVYGRIMSVLEARARQMEAEQEAHKNRLSDSPFGGHGEGNAKDVICKLFTNDGHTELLMYNGNKYVSERTLDDKMSKIGSLEQEIKELKNKARRLETLVNLKDERLCVLTMELHQAQQQTQQTQKKKSETNFLNNNHQRLSASKIPKD